MLGEGGVSWVLVVKLYHETTEPDTVQLAVTPFTVLLDCHKFTPIVTLHICRKHTSYAYSADQFMHK